jgi:hypothetical protein
MLLGQVGEIDVSLLSQLGSLAVLDLQNNAIQSVPPELGNLTQLRALQLEVRQRILTYPQVPYPYRLLYIQGYRN